jgi:hypothetical protein
MSQRDEPLVVKSIGIDAVALAGDKTVALMTLTDADGGEVEYAMDANGARMMIKAMEAYLNLLNRHGHSIFFLRRPDQSFLAARVFSGRCAGVGRCTQLRLCSPAINDDGQIR